MVPKATPMKRSMFLGSRSFKWILIQSVLKQRNTEILLFSYSTSSIYLKIAAIFFVVGFLSAFKWLGGNKMCDRNSSCKKWARLIHSTSKRLCAALGPRLFLMAAA